MPQYSNAEINQCINELINCLELQWSKMVAASCVGGVFQLERERLVTTEEKINRAEYRDVFNVYKLIPCLFLCMDSLENKLMHLKGLIRITKFHSALTECSIKATDETSLCCQIFSLANSRTSALNFQSLHQWNYMRTFTDSKTAQFTVCV